MRRLLLALLGYAALAPLDVADVLRRPRCADPAIRPPAYVIAWDAHQLSAPFGPLRVNSFTPGAQPAFGDHLPPEALMVAPVSWCLVIPCSPTTRARSALTASGLAMFLLVRELTASAAGASWPASRTRSTDSFIEIARVQVVHLEWPLSPCSSPVSCARRAPTRRGSRCSWAFKACLHVPRFSALVLPVWLGLGYAVLRRRPDASEWRALVFGFVLAGLAAAPLLWLYVGRLGEAEGTVSNGADLQAFVTPGAANPLYGGGAAEASYAREFVGHVALVLVLAGLWTGWRRGEGDGRTLTRAFTVMAAMTLLIGVVFALGPVVRIGGVERLPGPLAFVLDVLPVSSLRQTPRLPRSPSSGPLVRIAVGTWARACPASPGPPRSPPWPWSSRWSIGSRRSRRAPARGDEVPAVPWLATGTVPGGAAAFGRSAAMYLLRDSALAPGAHQADLFYPLARAAGDDAAPSRRDVDRGAGPPRCERSSSIPIVGCGRAATGGAGESAAPELVRRFTDGGPPWLRSRVYRIRPAEHTLRPAG